MLKDNSMLKVYPELWCEWDFEKNEKLGLDVYLVTKGIHKKAWWICDKGHEFESQITNRVILKRGCPYCSNRKILIGFNDMHTTNPELSKEWHPTLNGSLTPYDIGCGSGKKVWWLGNCGHEWEAVIDSRNDGRNCPYCSNNKVLKGYNDIWTTNPDLAKMLADPEDGYNYMQSSRKKVNWKCPDCEEIIKDKKINHISYYSLTCPNCSDGISYPEKVIYNLLKQLEVVFNWNVSFTWSEGKRYDFYFKCNGKKYIIEVHGGQHYNGSFKTIGGRDRKEEQENDRLKEELAKENSIDHYIVIDARESSMKYIKNSIMSSVMTQLFNLDELDWNEINKKSMKSIIKTVSELWNGGMTDSKLISKELNLSYCTIARYLKKSATIGWCNYKPNMYRKPREFGRKIIQLDLSFNYIKEWNSIINASKEIGVHSSAIVLCCKNAYRTSKGFKWMYKEDYEIFYSMENEAEAINEKIINGEW